MVDVFEFVYALSAASTHLRVPQSPHGMRASGLYEKSSSEKFDHRRDGVVQCCDTSENETTPNRD